MEEAIEWVKRCPNPHEEESDIEIRPVFEADELGDAFTSELREQEASIRAQALGLGALRFENSRELLIAGLNEGYTFESRVNIPAQWDRFVPHIGKVPTQEGPACYGVSWNTEPDRGFDYLCGVEITDTTRLPSAFTHVRLAAQRYAVFTHREPVSSIAKTFDTIWTKWAPDAGLEIGNVPSFERYTEKPDPTTEMGGMEIEIWIPIITSA
jgi:AraC family transcriptional regulator